jgi:hypothetical protein
VAPQVQARGLPLVITWVGAGGIQRYNTAAFAAGFDLTIFYHCPGPRRLSALGEFHTQSVNVCHFCTGAQGA